MDAETAAAAGKAAQRLGKYFETNAGVLVSFGLGRGDLALALVARHAMEAALRYPEWAAAIVEATRADIVSKEDSAEFARRLVEAVPIAVVTPVPATSGEMYEG